MPKKKTYNFKSLQGASSSKSKQSSGPNAGQTTASVNERLHDLRKLEAKDAEAKKRQLAESVNQRSVPPDVRGILGFSETAPPKPKASLRMRDRRRIPGPPPPKSWLMGASPAWEPSRKANSSLHIKPKLLLRFNFLTGLESHVVDRQPPSLTHITLKKIAESWDLLEEDEYFIFAQIPFRLRSILLSYLSFYGASLNLAGFQALIHGNEAIRSLDLAAFVGHRNLTLKRIYRALESTPLPSTHEESASVAESWDAAESFEIALSLSPTISRLSNLTHLCLSHPARTVSWRDLLALAKHIPQTTHLSLAYWPRPTLTPNLSTTTVSSQHSPDVTAGGSHYYSNIDRDLSEPASLIRQMSHHLLCLQWLDLEGCEEWIPALGKLASDADKATGSDGWATPSQSAPSIFTSHWKNLNYVRCAQGWLPSLEGIKGLSERRDGSVIDSLLVEGVIKYLQGIAGEEGMQKQYNHDTLDSERKWARLWLEREHGVTYATMRINSLRRAQGLRPVEADSGWIRRHAATT